MNRALLLLCAVTAVLGAAAASGCAEAIDETPCPSGGTELTYENFGKPFMDRHCNYCHGASVEERHGAPDTAVFDDRDSIVEHSEHIFLRSAGDNDSMPPGPDDPPIEEREQLAEWLACGAP